MRESLAEYWAARRPWQTFLYAVAALLLMSGLFHLGVYLDRGGAWAGPVSWRKPIVFGLSFGVTALSLAWILTFLPRRRGIGWLLSVTFGAAACGEVFLISMQRWRGVASHFNSATPFDNGVFIAMGVLVGVVALSVVALTVWSLTPSLQAPAALALAIRAGLVLLVAGLGFGYAILRHGAAQVSAGGSLHTDVFGAAGEMKLPHAVALHGVQVLAVLGWLLLFTRWDEARRVRAVAAGAAGYVGLLAVAAWQTFHGLAPFALAPMTALAAAASVALLAGAYAVTLAGLGGAEAGRSSVTTTSR